MFASYLIRVVPSKRVLPPFLKLFLESPDYWEQLRLKSAGTGQPNVNGQALGSLEFDLPPLTEQKRIVAGVDELMKRCDEVETRQKERNERRTALTGTCLHALTADTSPVPPSTRHRHEHAWSRVRDHFPLLIDTPESVAELRKTILQLAVQGRLVPQDPHDRASSVAGSEVQVPNAPPGWRCVTFSEIAAVSGGVTKGRRLTGKTNSYPYLRVANVQRGWLDLAEIKEIEIGVSELPRYALTPGDLLITEGGDWDKVGRMALWQGEIEPCLHQNHVFRARITCDAMCSDWILMYFNSEARDYFARAAKQTTNLASINMRQLRACPISVPPLAEQKRIVVKVIELMALCDALEVKLTQSREDADTLTAAAVHYLCNAGAGHVMEATHELEYDCRDWRIRIDSDPQSPGQKAPAMSAIPLTPNRAGEFHR